MATQIGNVAGEERRPLVVRDFDSSIIIAHQNEDTIFPLPSESVHTDKSLPSLSVPNQRLASLDVFRGLTVAVRPHFSSIPAFNSTASFLFASTTSSATNQYTF